MTLLSVAPELLSGCVAALTVSKVVLCVADSHAIDPGLPISMAPVVKLQFGDVHRFTRLVNDRLHIPTVRQLFDLNSIDVDGIVEPADDRGFTFTSYPVGSTLNISGTPSQGGSCAITTVTALPLTPVSQSALAVCCPVWLAVPCAYV